MTARDAVVRVGLEPRRLNRVRYLKKAKVLRNYDQAIWPNVGYLLADCEIDNFTYELENEDDLASWIAVTFGVDLAAVHGLLIEARSDPAIYEPLRRATERRWSMKTEPPIGRRLGWYAIVRTLKPRRMIETGIHDGLGSLVLLAALDRNAAEGADGLLVSTDIDKTAGWIVGSHPRWERRILRTPCELEALLDEPTDLFLHDSLHTVEHETFELELAASRLPGGVLISDNSHATDVLRKVAEEHGKRFAYWQERPRSHFYPGGGIGAAV